MCYSATHLEKLDGTREAQWQKVARLTPDDMSMVTNLEYLGVPGAPGGLCFLLGGEPDAWTFSKGSSGNGSSGGGTGLSPCRLMSPRPPSPPSP